MTNVTRLLKTCKAFNTLSALVVDDWLMYFVAMKEGLDRDMDQRLARFRPVTKEFEKSWINLKCLIFFHCQ
jgi:hypothetical protein